MAESADAALQLLAINTVRTLSMDAVQQADSGHPGTPMALAPLAYAIYHKHLRHNPADPHWPNRDRFVLSCGHASMLLYSALYLCGYDLSLDDIKQFRQWGSKTPGHPEVGHTAGVETTTGPLGQGLSNAVGMAFAERQSRGDIQSRRSRDRRPLHLVHRERRRSDGGNFARGRLVRRTPEARQTHRLFRQQPHHDRRRH